MHITIGIKIFGIAVGLLILMAVVALLSMRMTRTVDGEIEESAYARRLLLAAATPSRIHRSSTTCVSGSSTRGRRATKRSLRRASTSQTSELLTELDDWRDDFDRKIDAARSEMRRLAGAAIVGTRAYQHHVVDIGLALLALAALLGITVAAAVTRGLVRPVRRLLAGTAAVEQGALDTVVPITSRDEIGRLTQSFNSMVGELRMKAQIRETFGKYVDPRIVAGLIDRPELTDAKGSRREMTILFCDMRGFTTFSEGMTPAAVVTVLNRYMTLMSEPIRRNSGILDKYIGDGIMAFWGPPFTGADEQARLACLAALDQIAGLAAFRAELSDLTGLKRGLPEIDIRIGVATGDVVAGNIGSEQTRNYTVIGDAVNLASRLEGASEWQIFWRIGMPLMQTGLVTVALLCFVGAWNNFFLPLIVLNQDNLYPLTLGLNVWNSVSSNAGGRPVYNLIALGSLVSVLPLLIAFIVLGKYWRGGLTAGATKG